MQPDDRLSGLCAEKLRRQASPALMAKCGREEIYMARAHALKRRSDVEIAVLLHTDVVMMAVWARNNREFFDAITPTEAEFAAYDAKVLKERKKRANYRRKQIEKRPAIKVEFNMRSRVRGMIKGKPNEKGAFRLFGYTPKELIAHLESLFKPGMTWENYGRRWHVDHIKPCCLFDLSNPAQFKECWSLKNLQPLWARENLTKGTRYAGA